MAGATFSKGSCDKSRLRFDARVDAKVFAMPFGGVVDCSGRSKSAVSIRGKSRGEIPFGGSLDDIISIINVEKNQLQRKTHIGKISLGLTSFSSMPLIRPGAMGGSAGWI